MRLLLGAWLLPLVGSLWTVPVTAQAAAAAPLRGVAVTYASESGSERHTTLARLLSLAVERGETPTPFVAPGAFRASYRCRINLPLRERYRFRVDGRGSVVLRINGDAVLDGVLRPGKSLQSAEPARLKKGDNEIALEYRSSAQGEGQFRLYWSGPDFDFEPLSPEILLAEDSTELAAGRQREHGMALFAERRCATCHEAEERRIGESAFRELDAPGPDLRLAGSRLQGDWIASWLLQPRHFVPDSLMPQFALAPAEAADMATWLMSLGAPLPVEPFAAAAAEQGEALFAELGCVACHLPPASDAAAGDGRRALSHMPQKWQPAGLVAFLQDPRRTHRHGRMPDFRLRRDEAVQLAAYLLQPVATPLPAVRGDAARGRRLVQRHACAICHELDLEVDTRQWSRLPNLKPERGCLAEPGGRRGNAPEHALQPAELAALRSFLPHALSAPFRPSPIDYARRQLVAQDCMACHGLDGNPSRWAVLAEQSSVGEPLPAERDPRAQGIPALSWLGSKLQPGWMTRFLRGEERSPRPWLHARMPSFAAHAEPLIAGLVREHGYGAGDEPVLPADAQAAMHGERLVKMGLGFGCVQCHAIGDQPAVQVFERAGIDLALARQRLRREYYMRWMQDPPRIDPDARMPRYRDSDGKTAIRDVLAGDATQQFAAIWQYLTALQERR